MDKDSTDPITAATDTFSMGCVYFFALTGNKLFQTQNDIQNDKPQFGSLPRDSIKRRLISQMTQKNQANRPSMLQVLNSPFFWDDGKFKDFFSKADGYIETKKNDSSFLDRIEKSARYPNWMTKIDQIIRGNLERFAKKNNKIYDDSTRSLIRAVHNSVIKFF